MSHTKNNPFWKLRLPFKNTKSSLGYTQDNDQGTKTKKNVQNFKKDSSNTTKIKYNETKLPYILRRNL